MDYTGRPVLKLRVSAAASDGAANAAVIELMASALALSRSAIRIVSGHTARVKRLEIDAATDVLAQAVGNPSGPAKF